MFFDLIRKRRSIRQYLTRAVEPDKIELMVEAALRAPSSRGLRPWEFVLVTDKEKLKRLSASKPHGAEFLKQAPLAFAVCADPEKCDVWVEDASVACAFLMLAAEELGLGCCWVQVRERMHDSKTSAEENIRETLNIPARLKVEAVIAVGYPGEFLAPHKKENLPYEKVSHDTYGWKYIIS
ncbi:MAG: nitroreductase family protein [Bacillota bacterium]